MKIVIYSDVHANFPAFEAFRQDSRGADRYFFLGDAVVYGANPNECVRGIKDLSDITLLGNGDAAVCGLEKPETFNPLAEKSVYWTRREGGLSVPNCEWLKTLKRQHEDKSLDVCLNHSTPGDNYSDESTPENRNEGEMWHYLWNGVDAANAFLRFHQKISFIGHTHMPKAYVMTEEGVVLTEFPVDLKNFQRAIINVGSVGQPRDMNLEGSYVVYDTSKVVVELCRFEYDVEKAMRDILDAGLPKQHAFRLNLGERIQPR